MQKGRANAAPSKYFELPRNENLRAKRNPLRRCVRNYSVRFVSVVVDKQTILLVWVVGLIGIDDRHRSIDRIERTESSNRRAGWQLFCVIGASLVEIYGGVRDSATLQARTAVACECDERSAQSSRLFGERR